jgi:hypothetical protein
MNAIVGTFCVGEAPDAFKIGGGIGTLQEIFLLRLMQIDAKIWKAHYYAEDCRKAAEPEMTIPPHIAAHGSGPAHVSVRKRPTKRVQREQQRAADEARIAKFVRGRHPYVSSFSPATAIVIEQPKPKSHKRKAEGGRIPLNPQSAFARANALAAGEKTYVRERACKKCGGRIFRTHGYKCAECDRRAKRERNSLKRSKRVEARMN